MSFWWFQRLANLDFIYQKIVVGLNGKPEGPHTFPFLHFLIILGTFHEGQGLPARLGSSILCWNSSPDPGFLLSLFARCFSLQLSAGYVVLLDWIGLLDYVYLMCHISEGGKQCIPSDDIRPLLREKNPFCFLKISRNLGVVPVSVYPRVDLPSPNWCKLYHPV